MADPDDAATKRGSVEELDELGRVATLIVDQVRAALRAEDVWLTYPSTAGRIA